MTELGEIPFTWNTGKINDLIKSIVAGVSVNSENKEAQDGEYGILKTSAVSYDRFLYKENKTILNDELVRAKLNPIKNGIIVSRMNTIEFVGACAYVDKDYNNLFIPDRLWQLDVKDNTFSKWLYYELISPKIKQSISNIATGTSGSMKNISKNVFKDLIIHIPPIDEQQKIAGILSTVDVQIEQTEGLIEKTKELKKGIMQRLLTKGIVHTEFKETEVGVIPKEWEVKLLKDISENITIGLVKTMTKYYVDNGVPLIRNSDIKENKILNKHMVYLDKQFALENKEKMMRKGDIVTVHTGDIGTSGIIEEKLVGAHGFATLNTTVNKNIVDEHYLCWYFNSEIFKKQAYSFSTGDGRNNLNLKDFVNTLIIVPNKVKEQKHIADIISSVDEKIEQYEVKKQKLQLMKQGLMQKLLTGKIRVKV